MANRGIVYIDIESVPTKYTDTSVDEAVSNIKSQYPDAMVAFKEGIRRANTMIIVVRVMFEDIENLK